MTNEWDTLCNHCGGCCNLFKTEYACPKYDHANNRCGDYENRLNGDVICVQLTEETVPQWHMLGLLPDHCNYVLHMQGKELIWDVEPTQLTPFDDSPLTFKMQYYDIKRKANA